MFKNYKKKYEDVFTSERTLKKCDINEVSASGFSVIEYQLKLQEQIRNYQLDTFDHLVKIVWLFQKFTYKGKRRDNLSNKHGFHLDAAFGVFVKRYVGYDNKFFTRTNTLHKVVTYLNDFFPDFNISDPFESKYEYPYEYVSFECLYLVYQMQERLDLLEEAEKKRMSYIVFLDYIINYINCYNEEHGDIYELKISMNNPPYISCKNRRIISNAK